MGRRNPAPKLIDSSFFRVYTDPSKPPGIGDLEDLSMGPAGPIARMLLSREEVKIVEAAGLLVCWLPNCSPLTGTQQVQRPLRHVMGLFPLAGTISSMLHPLRIGAARSYWPAVLWRRCSAYTQQNHSSELPSRLTTLKPSSPSRATTDTVQRASESIQRTALERTCGSTASVLRRWMLPTVERGPPVQISV